jgi:hypothetical protein
MIKASGFDDNWLLPTGEPTRRMRQFSGQKRFVWNGVLAIEPARYRRGENESYQRFFEQTEPHPPPCKKKSKTKISFSDSDPWCFELDQQSDKGAALLASGSLASVNSLGSGPSWDAASNQEPAEAVCS